MVILLLVRLLLPIFESVLLLPEMVLFVSVCVSLLPTAFPVGAVLPDHAVRSAS
jgi:hypothetical protein